MRWLNAILLGLALAALLAILSIFLLPYLGVPRDDVAARGVAIWPVLIAGWFALGRVASKGGPNCGAGFSAVAIFVVAGNLLVCCAIAISPRLVDGPERTFIGSGTALVAAVVVVAVGIMASRTSAAELR